MARRLAALATLLLLAACATPRGPVPPPRPDAGLGPADLPGWTAEDHLAAFRAFARTCSVARDPAMAAACARARAEPAGDAAAARRFFETGFRVVDLGETGLLTAYFAPEYPARAAPDEVFSAAVKPKPPELVRGPDGRFAPWKTRAEIETSDGPALAWMKPEDLFFMQIQGSGYLTFPDGRRARAAYAADNGRPFVGIARPMAERGLLPPDGTSGEAIRAWLAEHRGPEAQAITDLNPRYIFFALEPDDGGHPRGAANVPLPAGHAVAVDPAHHAWGELLWIEAEGGNLAGAERSYRRLVVALDTGGAIKGRVRADLYLGRGERAGTEAGRVRHPLRMWRLEPIGR